MNINRLESIRLSFEDAPLQSSSCDKEVRDYNVISMLCIGLARRMYSCRIRTDDGRSFPIYVHCSPYSDMSCTTNN